MQSGYRTKGNATPLEGTLVAIPDVYFKLFPALVGMLLFSPLGPLGMVGGAILGAAAGTEAEHSAIEFTSRRCRRTA